MRRAFVVIGAAYLTVSCGGATENSATSSDQGGMSSGGNVSIAGQPSAAGAGSSQSCFGVSDAISSAELSERVETKLGVTIDPQKIEPTGDTPEERAHRLAAAIHGAIEGSALPGRMSEILRDFIVDRLLAQTDPTTQERRVQPFPSAVSPKLGAELDQEFELAITHWLSKGEGTLEHLLTDNTAFVNSLLAEHYGLPAPEGDGFVPVLLPRQTQMGLLTRGAFLARVPLPPTRGTLLAEALNCVPLIPAPPVMMSLWAESDRPPVKRIVEQSYGEEQSVCATCHDVYIGYSIALDRYDELGRYREQQNGVPIDTSAHLRVSARDDLDHLEFAGPEDLGRALSKAPSVQQCLIQGLVQRLGMTELSEAELRCVLGEFDAGSASLSALLVTLAPRWVGRE